MNATLCALARGFTHFDSCERGPIKVISAIALMSAQLGISGCASSDPPANNPATGGSSTAVGGKSAAGGKPGSSAGTGGITPTGGSAGKAGNGTGNTGAGGLVGTGGSSSAAGNNAAGGVGGSSNAGANNAGASNAGRSNGGGPNAGGAAGAGAGTAGNAGMNAAGAPGGITPENASADCEVAALPDASALTKITKLPDPFMQLNGQRTSTKAEWHCRRQEIRKQAEKYVFGEKPTPDVVTGTVTNSSVSVHVEAKGTSIDLSAAIVLPTQGQAPFPAIINVGSKGSLTLGESRILDQGVAVIYYDNYDLGKEGTAEQSRGKPNPGKYYDIYGGKDPAGLLMAWAWGASRLIDVLQKSGNSIIDSSSLGVTGCSRFGKGAFTIGVFDDRIALTIPEEPSTGGDPAFRIMDILPGAERTDYNYNGLNWLSDNFAPFVFSNSTSNAVKLPIDTHALVALIAPRGLLVLENPHQTQMGAPAGNMATVAGAEVYKALGVEKNVSYHSDVSDMAHCSYKNEYTDILAKSIDVFLKHNGEAPGLFKVASGGSVSRADWIDWTTPTLE